MVDLSQIGFDQYMIAQNSPLNNQGNNNVSNSLQYDNGLSAVTFAQGRITAPITVGGKTGAAYLRIDGQNNRFVSNDGTVNRIIIGSV